MSRLPLVRRLMKLLHPEGHPRLAAAAYDWVSGTAIFGRHYELVAEEVRAACAQGDVLDVGTGPGRLLLNIHAVAPQLNLTGVDVSPSVVAKARAHIAQAKASGRVRVVEADAAHLPFPDVAFDAVVSTASVHHWKDPIAGLDEIHRVLKPGGRALVYDILADVPAPVLRDAAREFGRLRTAMFWLHTCEEPFYSEASFARLADDSLFRRADVGYLGLLCRLDLRKAP